MKYFNYVKDGAPRLGFFSDGRWLEAETPSGAAVCTDDLITGAVSADSVRPGSELPPGFKFAPAVAAPDKILCAGLNYRDHAEETGGTVPERPVIFAKLSSCIAACGEDIPKPPAVRCLDYEAELVVVVGKNAYNVTEEEAGSCIFGYACGNDLSARDAQFLSNQWFLGKSLPGFSPLGPLLVTKDEIDVSSLAISCRLNGVTVQDSNTSNMIFSPEQLLAFTSKYVALRPGDLIYTGTPAGVILGKPKGTRVWMKAGDTVTVEIEGLGKLTNRFV
ncbi:MAG: fumarylacetoacetate hydrolase family protein [Oscillospiraceae bacterium]|nr:fumarylacetoacetate hydrolase family protein [Oscillospiraceae bacterium]